MTLLYATITIALFAGLVALVRQYLVRQARARAEMLSDMLRERARRLTSHRYDRSHEAAWHEQCSRAPAFRVHNDGFEG